MDLREEVRVAWGTGIAGYVAESGEPVNIPDAYQVKFTNKIELVFMNKGCYFASLNLIRASADCNNKLIQRNSL